MGGQPERKDVTSRIEAQKQVADTARPPVFLLSHPETIAAIIVSRIADDLRSVVGIREAWLRLPEAIRKRIVSGWLEHAKATVTKYTQPAPPSDAEHGENPDGRV